MQQAPTKSHKPKIGRPTLYSPDLCVKVIALGKRGKSKAQIAATLDVARQTLDDWAGAHPEFLDAITRARDCALAWWEDKGQASICNPKFQASFWAKSVSARFPDDYRETTRQEHAGKIGVVALVAGSDDAEV